MTTTTVRLELTWDEAEALAQYLQSTTRTEPELRYVSLKLLGAQASAVAP
jgi:hypothetical protein